MRKNTIIMGATLFFSLILFSFGFCEESFTITTYYPSPYGSYNDLYVANRLGIGTTGPQTKLHLLVPDDGGIRIQAGEGGWGPARIEFYSDPIGNANEWRPGYITSADSGSFTGRLDFYTNGTGSGSKIGSVLGMSIKNGNVGIGTASPNAKLEVAGGYIQILDQSSSPSSGDCNESSEYGRMVVVTGTNRGLYVCLDNGWYEIKPGVN